MAKMRLVCVAALLLTILCVDLPGSAAPASADVWATTGPFGAQIRSLLVSPTFSADQLVVAGTWKAGVFRSSNQGQTWASGGLLDRTIYALAAAPNFAASQVMFAGAADGFFWSANKGRSWSAANSGLGIHTWIQAIAAAPTFAADNTVFVGTFAGGVFKSTNGGVAWNLSSNGLTSLSVQALAASPN
jgi:photosystem II stability/assembly factor-like uncharacterized protein